MKQGEINHHHGLMWKQHLEMVEKYIHSEKKQFETKHHLLNVKIIDLEEQLQKYLPSSQTSQTTGERCDTFLSAEKMTEKEEKER